MNASIESVLESVVRQLRQNKNVNTDRIIDQLIELAMQYGKVNAMSADQLEVIIGDNARFYFDLDDCVGRFRHLLARLYMRCMESYPQGLNGGIYGFTCDVVLSYGTPYKAAKLRIKTKNQAGFPELAIETS